MRWLSFSILFLLGAVEAAFAWVPVGCSDRIHEVQELRSQAGERGDVLEAWTHFSESVRAAKPGSPVYAPRPYPRNQAEVREDFEYAFHTILVRQTPPEDLPEELRGVYQALAKDNLDIEILRVENWSTSRCGSDKLKPFYHLLRLYDRNSRREIGRMTVNDSGLWSQFRSFPASASGHWSQSIPRLDTLAEFLRRELGFRHNIQHAQYVTADGLSECSPVTPCIAFQSQGRVYLVAGNSMLYELGRESDIVSVSDLRSSMGRQLRQLEPEYEAPMISIGFAWVKARRIAGKAWGERK